MQSDVAATSTVWTYGIGMFHVLLARLACPYFAGQSPGWADRNTLTAEFTVQVFFKGCADFSRKAPEGEINGVDSHDLIANPYTFPAKDTFFHIPLDKRIGVMVVLVISHGAAGEAILANFKFIG